MAEKRKPVLTLLLRKPGARPYKIELFSESQWQKGYTVKGKKLYRLRINGKWFGKKQEFYNLKNFTNMLEQSIEALL